LQADSTFRYTPRRHLEVDEPGEKMHANKVVRHLVAAALGAGLANASLSLISTQAVGASPPLNGPVSVGSSAETGELFGVAATSGGDAWAVGYSGTTPGTKALTLYWNGSRWKPVPSPSPPSAVLRSVAATSLTNAWAVGYSGDFSDAKTLILHRNGRTWHQMPSTAGTLYGVAATSLTNAWAVGSTNSGHTLILHWNGKTWLQMPSTGGALSGVAATSRTNAWAVGSTNSGHTLILHWNGKTWEQRPSPNPGSEQGLASVLSGVAAPSGGTIWAVGNGNNCGCGPGRSLIERWNGNTWGQVPTPTFGGGINLFAVASLPSGGSWAVGLSGSGDGPTSGVILQWTGTAWTRVPVPDLRSDDGGLDGLAATSRSNAWAVGWESAGGSPAGPHKIVILHWKGSTWMPLTMANSAKTPVGGAALTPTTTTLAPTTTTLAPTATATVPSTTPPPPTTTGAAPTLGSAAWGAALGSFAGISGFGEVAPDSFSEGPTAESPHVNSISWSNWGAPQAMGQGQAIDGIGQSGPVSSWPVKTATVVAFDLGSCDGSTPAYQKVTYYFPQDGQTFDPTMATNACTGQ
jgi:hypothetical protein